MIDLSPLSKRCFRSTWLVVAQGPPKYSFGYRAEAGFGQSKRNGFSRLPGRVGSFSWVRFHSAPYFEYCSTLRPGLADLPIPAGNAERPNSLPLLPNGIMVSTTVANTRWLPTFHVTASPL